MSDGSQAEASSDLVSVLMTRDAAGRFLEALSYAESIVHLRAEELADSEGTSRRVQTATKHGEWLRWGYRWVVAHYEGRDCPDCGHLRVNLRAIERALWGARVRVWQHDRGRGMTDQLITSEEVERMQAIARRRLDVMGHRPEKPNEHWLAGEEARKQDIPRDKCPLTYGGNRWEWEAGWDYVQAVIDA